MHPLQAQLIEYAADVTNKVAAAGDQPATGGAPRLWQYVDPEGGEFYLPEKLLTLHSPYTGKTFTTKPEKSTLADVGKHLKEKAKQARIESAAAFHPEQGKLAAKVATVEEKLAAGTPVLFRYSDPESGKDFYLPKKLMSVRSPYTGKVFQAKPDRSTISEVSKELKGKTADAETLKKASEEPASEGAWKVDFPVDPADTKPKSWKNEDGE